jgi:hypothetical protein
MTRVTTGPPAPLDTIRSKPVRDGGEPVTPAMLGLNKLAILAKRFAQGKDLELQIVGADDHTRPNPALQLVFCNERSIGLDEHHQYIERACAEFDRHAAGEQSTLAQQHAEAAELERCVGWARPVRDRKAAVIWLAPRFCPDE